MEIYMDISAIDAALIEFFGSAYDIATEIFDCEPNIASPGKQKKIRKWIEKNYIDESSLPKKFLKYASKEVSNAEFFEFFRSCAESVKEKGTQKKQRFDKFSEGLEENVKEALWWILDHDVFPYVAESVENGFRFELENGGAYCRNLILTDAFLPELSENEFLSFENGSLIKDGEQYKLVGERMNYEDDTAQPFVLRFSAARVEVSLFSAVCFDFDSPWLNLQAMAAAIVDKYSFLSEKYLNDAEKELLPLLVELARLSYFSKIPDKYRETGFAELKKYAEKYRYNEILPILTKLENYGLIEKKRIMIAAHLTTKLDNFKYQPLWRELFELIASSQSKYPILREQDENTASISREKIQKLMEARGYIGEYPDFVKNGRIRGIRLAESHQMSYFVCGEKRAVHYIHIDEKYEGGTLNFCFMCGVELLRKNEQESDIYSCMFNSNGRRFFKRVSCDVSDGQDDLETKVRIAIKRAELEKLSKEEKKAAGGQGISLIWLFIFCFLFMGGLFAVFMTLGMMLVSVAVALMFGEAMQIPQLFVDIPWWQLFVFAWVAFGGIMGIVEVMAKRK